MQQVIAALIVHLLDFVFVDIAAAFYQQDFPVFRFAMFAHFAVVVYSIAVLVLEV